MVLGDSPGGFDFRWWPFLPSRSFDELKNDCPDPSRWARILRGSLSLAWTFGSASCLSFPQPVGKHFHFSSDSFFRFDVFPFCINYKYHSIEINFSCQQDEESFPQKVQLNPLVFLVDEVLESLISHGLFLTNTDSLKRDKSSGEPIGLWKKRFPAKGWDACPSWADSLNFILPSNFLICS